ncbi:Vacuolar protein-sorting-associated protein 25 [Ophiophagus hannah]|uniref:Vacuolar protein-sorting-associated protein 25 n=1 Tax=Ophiophagus hannah TaxID=8665 RepID=V8NHD5_OPHHA|nr:Vacuolar protein-sorting-associated protein 25 [Ophiophagus hannah]
MMSFEWPWQYSFPPFFTSLVNFSYLLFNKGSKLGVAAQCGYKAKTADSMVFLSALILPPQQALYYDCSRGSREPTVQQLEIAAYPSSTIYFLNYGTGKLSLESILVVLEELRKKGNLEWLDKNKSSFLILWRCPEEWGKLIYQWVLKNGLTNSVFTLYELSNGEDTEEEEFHGLEELVLLRALQALQQEHKAEIFTLNDGRGVKFF